MTDGEMTALKEGFETINKRISDLEAKFSHLAGEIGTENLKESNKSEIDFKDLPTDFVNEDKSEEIRSWYNKKLF